MNKRINRKILITIIGVATIVLMSLFIYNKWIWPFLGKAEDETAYTTGTVEIKVNDVIYEPQSVTMTCGKGSTNKNWPIAVNYKDNKISFKTNTREKDIYDFVVYIPDDTFSKFGFSNNQLKHHLQFICANEGLKDVKFKITLDYKQKNGNWFVRIEGEVDNYGEDRLFGPKEFPLLNQSETTIGYGG